MSRRRLASSSRFIADPLLTALSVNCDPPWSLAPNPWRLRLHAQPNTANGTIHTHALVFTAWHEALPVTVDHAVVLAACSRHIWQRRMRRAPYINQSREILDIRHISDGVRRKLATNKQTTKQTTTKLWKLE